LYRAACANAVRAGRGTELRISVRDPRCNSIVGFPSTSFSRSRMLVRPSPRPLNASSGSNPIRESRTVNWIWFDMQLSYTSNRFEPQCLIAFCSASRKTRKRQSEISSGSFSGTSLEWKSISTFWWSQSSLQKLAAAIMSGGASRPVRRPYLPYSGLKYPSFGIAIARGFLQSLGNDPAFLFDGSALGTACVAIWFSLRLVMNSWLNLRLPIRLRRTGSQTGKLAQQTGSHRFAQDFWHVN